jgi:hypothetical protein
VPPRRLTLLALVGASAAAACLPIPHFTRVTPSFSGVVTRRGAPVAGARVLLSASPVDRQCAEHAKETKTDAAGAFSLPAVYVFVPYILLFGDRGSHESLCIETEEGRVLGYERDGLSRPEEAVALHCELSAPLHAGGSCWRGRDTAPAVFGYVDDGRFHPLVALVDSQFVDFDADWMSLSGVLRDAFEKDAEAIAIERQERHGDESDSDATFGVVPGRSEVTRFFELNRGPEPRHAETPSLALQASFLRAFARDSWGRRFAEAAEPGDEAGTIEREGNIRMLYATELGGHGGKELWIAYRLGNGKVGRMIWEQGSTESDWVQIANHCFACD